MNFFDYELTRSATPPSSSGTASPANVPEPSLNEEVSQVVGQLGKLWGGFRKQSQIALESARKDLGTVVAQAQKELGKLASEPVASSSKVTTDNATDDSPAATGTSEEGETSTISAEANVTPQSVAHPAQMSPFQSLFTRVQSSLPPNITATLERNLPAGNLNVDLAQLRTTLTSEFQRVQGVTRAQAEEYVHKSEALLKEAGEYLKDAVKIVPPEDQEGATPEMMFDGSDVVFMPPLAPGNRSKGKGKETAAQAELRLAGTRAAAMLSQLKRDPDVVRQDPTAEDTTRELYESWLSEEVQSKGGGMDGSFWTERINVALAEEGDGVVLGKTKDALVPSSMDLSTFWTRYFFRARQVEKDEEKRKELLAASGAVQNDEDFNWEDDEDEGESATPLSTRPVDANPAKLLTTPSAVGLERVSSDTLQPGAGENQTALSSYPSSLVTTPSGASPRGSSEGSYSVVSPGSPGTDVKATAEPNKEKAEKADDEDGDSDWE